ncbi:MAG: LysR family transcriptional regulator [Pseudomonadota bacterium]
MDQFQAMKIFSSVAELGSFTKAADRLQLPKASVTNAVQALEKHFRVQLLQRTTRKVSLTQEGALYQQHCLFLLAEMAQTEQLFSGTFTKPKGVINVELPERLARLTVIPALPDFFAKFPDIELRLGASDRLVDLIGEGIDCAVRVGELPDSSMVARRIGMMEQINCGAKSYLDRAGRPQTLDDLRQHVAVNYFSSRTGRDLDWEYRADGKDHTLKMRSNISVSSSEAYLACCVAGLGLIQAPRSGIEELFDAELLEEILPQWTPAPLPVSVIYAQQRHLSPRVRAFVDWVADLYR